MHDDHIYTLRLSLAKKENLPQLKNIKAKAWSRNKEKHKKYD